MTVQEVKEKIQEYDNVAGLMMNIPHDACMAIIEALSELEQYRALGTVEQLEWCKDASHWKSLYEEKLAQYESFGTVEELKEAREKQVAKKPTFVDTRFRQRGKLYGECVTLDRCYKCPNCYSHIFHDYDSELYCKYCGQALKWGEEDD